MSFTASLLAPFLLLLPGAAAVEPMREEMLDPAPVLEAAADNIEGEGWGQVRIEQRMTIRVAPRPPAMMPRAMFDMDEEIEGPRFIERKMGQCLAVSAIAGVQSAGGTRLVLFLRDQRMVSASLERACRARDFYSGFYLARSNDGQLCIDRDALLSRNGANCKITRLRQLILLDE